MTRQELMDGAKRRTLMLSVLKGKKTKVHYVADQDEDEAMSESACGYVMWKGEHTTPDINEVTCLVCARALPL